MTYSPAPGFDARKRSTLSFLSQYQEQANLDQQGLEQTASASIKDVLDYCFRNLPWWRDRLGEDFRESFEVLSGAALLRQIPILSKADLQNNFKWLKNWVPGSKSGHYFESKTSGSTGQPVKVLKYGVEYNARQKPLTYLMQFGSTEIFQTLIYF